MWEFWDGFFFVKAIEDEGYAGGVDREAKRGGVCLSDGKKPQICR